MAGGRYQKKLTLNCCFLFLGEPRVNEWVGLTAMHTMFVREHNRIANFLYDELRMDNRLSDNEIDEEVFQRARRIVIAEIQVRMLYSFCGYDQ